MSQLKRSFFVFAAVGLIAFAGSYGFLIGRGANRAAETVEPGTTDAKGKPLTARENPPEKIEPAVAAAVDEAANPKPAPGGELFLKRFPLPDTKDAGGASSAHDSFNRALCLAPSGTRAVAVSPHETRCLDLSTGKILHTYRNEQTAPKTTWVAASPDARFVVVPSADGKELTLHDAETGRKVASHRIPEDQRLSQFQWDSRSPSFTPAGNFLLVGVGSPRGAALHAVSTRTGSGETVATRFDTAKRELGHVLAIPQLSTLLVANSLPADRKNNPSGLSAVDLSTGKETPLTCLRIQPALLDVRPLVLSPDGSLLLVKGADKLQVCDWCSDRLLFDHAEKNDHYVQPCFTPDGKRFAVIRRVSGLLRFEPDPNTPGRWEGHRIDDEIHLFDIARQEIIGTFTPKAHGLDSVVGALAMSADGKSLAIWSGSEVALVDFQAAFGVAPIAPGPRLEGPEQLPLAQPGGTAQQPKKQKK